MSTLFPKQKMFGHVLVVTQPCGKGGSEPSSSTLQVGGGFVLAWVLIGVMAFTQVLHFTAPCIILSEKGSTVTRIYDRNTGA